ncbi:tetratricopeptide repeat protein [Streptomyces sp. NPDC087422]|uniref:tetratricopeptide repeat protein n=1 Tax=Streptomyces sp. NPDC087422 TaxID=3365786 RepID=UPI00381F0C5A
MHEATVEELTAAFVRADGTAMEVLARLLPDSCRPWLQDLPGGAFHKDVVAVRAAARRVMSFAAARPDLLTAVRIWLAAVSANDIAPAGDVTVIANSISGGTRINGPTLQARDISGGIHVHGSAPPVPSPLRPVPRQLLPRPVHFTGRNADLAALESIRSARTGASVLVVISGTPGVGKTALVSHWLSGLTSEYPAGQLYVDLQGYSDIGPADPGAVLGQFLRALGIDHAPASLAEQAALWRTVTADLRIAVMLDNAYSAAQIRPLLPASPGALAAVTSRRRLSGLGVNGAAFHHLDVLELGSALELLSRRIGAERVAREREIAYGLARMCGGLPLALCVAAARMSARPKQPLSSLVGAMAREDDRLAVLDAGEDRAVRTALDDSYAALPPDVALGYRQLGLSFITEFGPDVVAAARGGSREDAARTLDELVDASLVEELGPDRFRLHDLIRLHAFRRATKEDSSAARETVVRRVLDWYLATATEARKLLSPSHRELRRDYAHPPAHVFSDGSSSTAFFSDDAEALAWFDRERLHLLAAVRLAAERELFPTAWQLVDSMQPLFLRLRPYDLWIEAHVIGLAAAERAGHPEGVSRMLTTGGSGFYNVGRYDEAIDWFGRALEDARGRADRRAEAQALHGLGQSHRLTQRLDRAFSFFQQALAIREVIGYVRGAALSRLCLGDIALASGDPRGAIDFLSRARADLLAVPDPYDAARALAFLGRAHAAEGIRDLDGAERQLTEALAEFAAAGSVHWQGHVLEMLGQTSAERGDREKARDWYEQSLAHYAPVSPLDARRLKDRLRSLEEDPSAEELGESGES